MTPVAQARRRIDWWWLVSTSLLAGALLFFALVHFEKWRATGRPVGLGLMAQETVAALLIVVRRRPRGTSVDPVAWLATGIGSFGMLAARPGDHALFGLEPAWVLVQTGGAVLAALSLGSLGRSFGLVAANRGVQTRGAYRVVRHPAYASYLITNAGYLLENPTLWNVLVMLFASTFQLVRIGKEETFLSADPAYREYLQTVRYRLVPFLY